MAINPLVAGALTTVAVNAGVGPHFDALEVGHPDYVAFIEVDAAFWALVPGAEGLDYLLGTALPQAYLEKEAELKADLDNVRFKLLPTAVYFNPTERCNLNCSYCYLPSSQRQHGEDMTPDRVLEALAAPGRLSSRESCPSDVRPQIVFHGSEPLLAKEALFQGIEAFGDKFRFGVQTNATLLDEEAEALPGQPGGSASACPWTAPPPRWRTAPGTPGPVAASLIRWSGFWRDWRTIRGSTSSPPSPGKTSEDLPDHRGLPPRAPGEETPCSTRSGAPSPAVWP